MTTNERVKRDNPDRVKPARDFWSLLDQGGGGQNGNSQARSDEARSSEAGGSESDSGTGFENGAGWSETVTYGVNLGYRVIEEQIRQGRLIAEQVSSGPYGMGAVNSNMQDMAQSIQRYCEDTAQLYLKMMESMTSEVSKNSANGGTVDWGNNSPLSSMMDSFLGNLNNFNSANSSESANDKPDPAGGYANAGVGTIALSVASKQAVDINVNLQIPADLLVVDRLYEKDIDKPPITDIKLSQDKNAKLKLHIKIADDHPVGSYKGIIYNSANDQHCGTLVVSIIADEADSN